MKRKSSADDDQSVQKGDKEVTAPDDRSPAQKRGDAIRTSAQRETVEAFVVAFILALLFRAFIAEAFVIPTGSMAPTLMGAHKDVRCEQCDHRFQIGASKERRGPQQDDTVVAGICPNCRFLNNLDLAGESNDATFNGDRILVSKFAYTISDPKRWDVIVFKFPGNPKQNYIKRLVGLPNETLTIQHGDVYVAQGNETSDTILRKPPHKLMAMAHHVYDTDQQSDWLIKSGFPSRMQPWRPGATTPPTDSWQIERGQDGLTASVDAGSVPQWLRYFHRWPSDDEWNQAETGGSLQEVDPYSSRLITDFYAYDCYITVPSRDVYETTPSNARMARGVPFAPEYQSGGPITQFRGDARFGDRGFADEGLNWVGDLIVETDLTPDADCKQLIVELVEAGIQYQCQIDLQSGKAELAILDGQTRLAFDGDVQSPAANTPARAGTNISLRMSNCDDQILLWINGDLQTFDTATSFDARKFRSAAESYPRYSPEQHPLDASPIGIAVADGKAVLNRVKVLRDKYYIATNNSSFGIIDYDMSELFSINNQNLSFRDVQAIMATPSAWSEYPIWKARRKVTFQLGADQFFPMGDNSPESLDARCWAGTKVGGRLPDRFHDEAYLFADASYVPRDLLVGKALLVFWPHPWNTPVPFTPNFDRFRLIR